MPKYLNKIVSSSTSDTIYIEEYNKLVRGKSVVMIGDSSIGQMTQEEIDLLKLAMPDCTITKTATAARWTNVYDAVRNYAGDPDIYILLAGSNDLVSNETVADTCGAPDIALQHGIVGDTTAFNSMRLTLDYIRANHPRAEIYCLQRANHPQKRRSAWYYFKYYEAAIMKEYGVPVIDTNDILNLTYWSDDQKAIYVQSDGLHYTHEMYIRYLTTLGYMLESNVTPSDMELPNCFYAPASVLDSNLSSFDPANIAAAVRWVFEHCYTRAGGNQGQYLAGGVIVPVGGSTVFYEFEGNGSYSTNMQTFMHCRSIVKRPDELLFIESNASGDPIINSLIMSEAFYDSTDPKDLASLPDGDYVFLAAVAQASTNFPAGNTSGGHVTVRRNRTRAGLPNGNGLFTFHAYSSNKLYIGTNVGTGSITWAEVQKV